jgi:Kdo2-lipid IVA lauroyltransferase/acyltransferase
LSNTRPKPAFWKNSLAWIGIAIGKLIAALPWCAYRPMANCLAWPMRMFMRERGHIARTNIQLCFPELSVAEQKKLWRDSFNSLAFSLFEFARGWWGKLRKQDAEMAIVGIEHLIAAQQSGRGVLLVSAHLTTLEYCSKILCERLPVAGMYRPFDSDVFEWSVYEGRLRHAKNMFGRDELRSVLRYLKSGGTLWFAPDQETRRGESVYVPFFNQSALSLTSTHQLAKLSNALVLPFFHQRMPDGSYHLEIGSALENFPSQDATADTARVMHLFEQMIRRCPEQYLWLHARFKRQADGKKLY